MDCLRVKDQWFRKEDKKNMKENLSLKIGEPANQNGEVRHASIRNRKM